MKRLFFIWFFIPLISYCQTDSEFKLQNSISVEWGKNCINEMDCFYLSLDTNEYVYSLYYSFENENMKQIATGDWTELVYSADLHSFQNENANSYIVLWEKANEYNPFFTIFYLFDGKIVKIGEWGIAISRIDYYCEFCDYSVEDIRITQKNDEIEFSFLKDIGFMIVTKEYYDYDDWELFKAGELIISYNIVDGMVKRIEK